MITIGSLFSGIGGFELGLERAIPNAKTIWQVEQNEFCRKILEQHWADAKIYDDVRNITKDNVERVDILCGGFPCQDLSVAGKGRGINAERSGLWWEMHRIINELQPSIAIMENVPAITIRGLGAVLGSLSEIGYDAEWCTIRASDFGAPHRRERWFGVAYPQSVFNQRWITTNTNQDRERTSNAIQTGRPPFNVYDPTGDVTNAGGIRCHNRGNFEREHQHRVHKQWDTEKGQQQRGQWQSRSGTDCDAKQSIWREFPTQSPVCRRNDGVSNRVDRIKALGNAIVPQCSEWIGHQIVQSGLLDDLLGGSND